jgi:protein SCO1/2
MTGGRRWLPGAVLWLLVVVVGSAWILQQRAGPTPVAVPTALPVLGTVPAFELTERNGRTVTLADLSGRVWVVTFFFSRCPDSCALQNARLARLQTELADASDVRLVSITVDPGHDTPPVLQEYAARFGADARRWLFLTGEMATIVKLAQESFRVSVIPAPAGRPTSAPVVASHSPGLILVDQQAQIRGYYHSEDPADAARLRVDVGRISPALQTRRSAGR